MNTSIGITSNTKLRLDKIKRQTYDNTIEMLLDYFDVTGIDPKSRILSPSTEIRDVGERIIKILRAFENSYFKKLDGNIEIFQNAIQKIRPEIESKKSSSEVYDSDDVQSLIRINKDQELVINNLQETIKKLEQTNLNNTFSGVPKNELLVKIEGVLAHLKELSEKSTKSNIEPGKVLLADSFFQQKLRLIKNDLQSLV